MKKIVIFGGGSGLSQILKGLRLFPLDITAVVSVADNGASTGKLRKELNIPAVGDISKVLLSMANCDEEIIDLMNYRFEDSCSVKQHSIKNLVLTALLNMHDSFDKSLPIFTKLLDIQGEILPFTEDVINLVGITPKGKRIVGEVEITKSKEKIIDIKYDKPFKVNPKVFSAIDEADLIIFSSGSLYTSIMPHLVDRKLNKHIRDSKAKVMYISNLFTDPGETESFSVNDHIIALEKKLGKDSIDVVLANSKIVNSPLLKTYLDAEKKKLVEFDKEILKAKKIRIISDDLIVEEDNYFRHDSLKTSYLIFSYLMRTK
jgi:uncharacterized cofD-like protein